MSQRSRHRRVGCASGVEGGLTMNETIDLQRVGGGFEPVHR
jgi:hypothetical protein